MNPDFYFNFHGWFHYFGDGVEVIFKVFGLFQEFSVKLEYLSETFGFATVAVNLFVLRFEVSLAFQMTVGKVVDLHTRFKSQI